MTTTIDEMFLEMGLAHHGIPGMKWGQRRERGSDGTVGGNPDNAVTNPRSLSDSDLRSAVNRMQLERQFTQLQSERVQAGSGFAKQILKDIGKQQVRRVASKTADLAIEAALTKAGKKTGNPALGELAKRMKPKKK